MGGARREEPGADGRSQWEEPDGRSQRDKRHIQMQIYYRACSGHVQCTCIDNECYTAVFVMWSTCANVESKCGHVYI